MSASSSSKSCSERFGNTIDRSIASSFFKLGTFVGGKPRWTILLSFLLTILCGIGFLRWETESRGEELWIPQDTTAEREEEQFLEYFPRSARFNQLIVTSNIQEENVLTKDMLVTILKMHTDIETNVATVDGEGKFDFLDLCAPTGGGCATSSPLQGTRSVCNCLISSIFKQWNYNVTLLQEDKDYLSTLNGYGSKSDFEAVFGAVEYGQDGSVVSAQALALNYFLEDRSVVESGQRSDPINKEWEGQIFLTTAENPPSSLTVNYFAGRSLEDEFGSAISGDLTLVQVSYVIAFVFLGATLGRIKCGTGSRWTMALAALVMVGLSTCASYGLSSAFGLFFGPVHSLLPFILLGIGLDDAFVIGKIQQQEIILVLCVKIADGRFF